LYSSSNMRKRFNKGGGNNNNNNNKNRNELFGFRRAVKRVARKVLPTKWFGTPEEKEALVRKQEVNDRMRGELDKMVKGAPLPVQAFVKYVAAPLMGKIAAKVAEASIRQQETMEAILDEVRELLGNDPSIVGLLGTPIQIGKPFQQRSGATVINGRRQMRTEFSMEISGPLHNGVCRVVATNEGIGQLLVESNGKVYNVDLTSEGNFFSPSSSSSSSSSSRRPSASKGRSAAFRNNDNVIEAEIIDKETK